jgi:hypothetical protein
MNTPSTTSSLSDDEEFPASEGWTPEAIRQFEAGLRILARMIAADIIKKRSQQNVSQSTENTEPPKTGG